MTWFRIDDGWWCHRKTLGVSDAAAGLWVKMGCYSSAQLTDGVVPTSTVPLLTKLGVVELGDALDELVKIRFLERTKIGDAEAFKVHNFERYNPTKKKVLAERKRRSDAGKKGGRIAHERCKQVFEADAEQVLEGRGNAPSRPVPSRPVPAQPKEGKDPHDDFISAYDLELAYRRAYLGRNKHEPTNAASDAARVARWASEHGIRKPDVLTGMLRVVAEGKTLFQMTFEWDKWQAKPAAKPKQSDPLAGVTMLTGDPWGDGAKVEHD